MPDTDPQESAPDDRPLVAFAIDPALRDRVLAVVEKLQSAERPKAHAAELAAMVSELTRAGLHYYFMRPLEKAEAGFMQINTARIGLASAGKSLPLIVNRVMKSMTDAQLLSIVDTIADLLVEEVDQA